MSLAKSILRAKIEDGMAWPAFVTNRCKMSGTSVIILELFSGVENVAALGSRVLQCKLLPLMILIEARASAQTSQTSLIRPFRALSQCFQLWNGLFASPPCDQSSRAHTCGTRNSERADVLAKRMWKFIDILKPERVLIEYPSSSMLWKRDFMLARAGTTFVMDYCEYRKAYRKPTMLGATGRCRDSQQRRARALGNVQRLHHPHVATS